MPRNHIRGADAQTRFETVSKKSREPPLSEVNTSRSGDDRLEHLDDLTDFVPPTPHDSPLLGGHTPKRGDSMERAITTDASLVAAQDSDNITKTPSMAMSNDHISHEIGSGDRRTCQETTLGVQMLKLGLRLYLKSPVNHLSQKLTHLEVEMIDWSI
nr:hypothetical protein [Tanacetum cinerariifolium]